MEKHIYIFRTETNSCKIGVSKNISQRKSTIAMQGNNIIVDVFYTPKCYNAFEIENKIHKYFNDKRIIGEWFDVDYFEACMKLDEMFNKYAITEPKDETIKYCDYHSDRQLEDKKVEITLSNNIIDDLELSDSEIAVYVALMSICSSSKNTQFVSYNMIGYELFGSNNYKRCAQENIKNGLDSLIKKGLIPIVQELSKTEFELDTHKLFFDFNEDEEYYTIIRRDEIHKIMNIDNKMDKFKLLRYYTICIRTLCRSKSFKGKSGIIGFMPVEYLCNMIGVSFKTNSKLIYQYNKVLEENKIMYINHNNDKFIQNSSTGRIRSYTNNYGRYEDKDYICEYAIKNINESIENDVISESNKRRKYSAWYNNLCNDFDKYIKIYSDKELIEMYEYIHSKNNRINDELDYIKESSQRNDLLNRLKDEDILLCIPCIKEYIDKRLVNAS